MSLPVLIDCRDLMIGCATACDRVQDYLAEPDTLSRRIIVGTYSRQYRVPDGMVRAVAMSRRRAEQTTDDWRHTDTGTPIAAQEQL